MNRPSKKPILFVILLSLSVVGYAIYLYVTDDSIEKIFTQLFEYNKMVEYQRKVFIYNNYKIDLITPHNFTTFLFLLIFCTAFLIVFMYLAFFLLPIALLGWIFVWVYRYFVEVSFLENISNFGEFLLFVHSPEDPWMWWFGISIMTVLWFSYWFLAFLEFRRLGCPWTPPSQETINYYHNAMNERVQRMPRQSFRQYINYKIAWYYVLNAPGMYYSLFVVLISLCLICFSVYLCVNTDSITMHIFSALSSDYHPRMGVEALALRHTVYGFLHHYNLGFLYNVFVYALWLAYYVAILMMFMYVTFFLLPVTFFGWVWYTFFVYPPLMIDSISTLGDFVIVMHVVVGWSQPAWMWWLEVSVMTVLWFLYWFLAFLEFRRPDDYPWAPPSPETLNYYHNVMNGGQKPLSPGVLVVYLAIIIIFGSFFCTVEGIKEFLLALVSYTVYSIAGGMLLGLDLMMINYMKLAEYWPVSESLEFVKSLEWFMPHEDFWWLEGYGPVISRFFLAFFVFFSTSFFAGIWVVVLTLTEGDFIAATLFICLLEVILFYRECIEYLDLGNFSIIFAGKTFSFKSSELLPILERYEWWASLKTVLINLGIYYEQSFDMFFVLLVLFLFWVVLLFLRGLDKLAWWWVTKKRNTKKRKVYVSSEK